MVTKHFVKNNLDSELHDVINKAVLKLQEDDTLTSMKEKWWKSNSTCEVLKILVPKKARV